MFGAENSGLAVDLFCLWPFCLLETTPLVMFPWKNLWRSLLGECLLGSHSKGFHSMLRFSGFAGIGWALGAMISCSLEHLSLDLHMLDVQWWLQPSSYVPLPHQVVMFHFHTQVSFNWETTLSKDCKFYIFEIIAFDVLIKDFLESFCLHLCLTIL